MGIYLNLREHQPLKLAARMMLAAFVCLASSVARSESGERVDVRELRPTQAVAGFKAVDEKAKRLAKLSKSERLDYLKAHPVPVVIGPKNRLYMIDHHHLALAILATGHHHVFVETAADWSGLSERAFWEQMDEHGYDYLYANGHEKIEPSQLPKSILGIKDDPYRSLAYFAREAGAFKKTTTPFSEYSWADFYRTRISEKALRASWDSSVQKAIAISGSSAASNLPGFIKPKSCRVVFQ